MSGWIRHVIFAFAGLFFLVFILLSHWLSIQAERASLARMADSYSDAILSFRAFYSEVIVSRLAGHEGVEITHDYLDNPHAIPIPATMTLDLVDYINRYMGEDEGHSMDSLHIAQVSQYPFPWREERELTLFQQEALQVLSQSEENKYQQVQRDERGSMMHYAKAIRMEQSCIACHNYHPDSPKTDWQVGDLRAIQVISLPTRGLAEGLNTMAWSAAVFVLLSFLAAFFALYWMDGRVRRSLLLAEARNQQREQALKALDDRQYALDQHAIVSIADSTGRITYANEKFCQISGYSLEELLGQNHRVLKSDRHTPEFYRQMWQTISSGQIWQGELCNRQKDGDDYWLAATIVPFMNERGKPEQYVSIRTDITERIHNEDELRIAAVAFSTTNSMVITDPEGVILRVNSAFTRLTGYSAAEAVGETLSLLKSGRHPPVFYQRMWQSLKKEGHWKGEIWNRRKDGQIYAELLSINAVVTPDNRGITHYIGIYSDISDDKDALAEIHRMAYYDPLTKLPNRRLLQDRLGQAVAATARSGLCGAIFFIDLDHFKKLNDTRGHDAGDQLLVDIAQRLKVTVRDNDTVARQGGDEFVVLVENLGRNTHEAGALASHLGEKLRAAFDQPFILGDYEYKCNISIGVALFNAGDTVEALFKHADLALYQAKNAGRNLVRFFETAMQAEMEQRNALEADLRNALQRQELRLDYQLQVDAKGCPIGVEALLRWQHPECGLVPPDDFIPLAEETGLILPIGLWVLETACAQLAVWAADPTACKLHIAVNVSARQFRQTDFVSQVQQVLADSGAASAQLKLELTESMMFDNIDNTIKKMTEIKQLGVSFAMDDFGTGYSSLAYLAQLPLDQLKIDKSFVCNLPGNKNDETIARTIIGMGRGLGMDVIAEGIETEAQRHFLETHGCHAYQGYLFSRPLPIDELNILLLHHAGNHQTEESRKDENPLVKNFYKSEDKSEEWITNGDIERCTSSCRRYHLCCSPLPE